MTDALILDAVRTPIGKLGGALSGVRPDDLAATALKGLLDRHPSLDPAAIEEVYLGDANGAGEDNRNVARDGGAPGRPSRLDPGCHRQSALRIGPRGRQRREPSRCRRRGRSHHRRRRRVDDSRSVGAAQAVARVPDDARAGLELGARVAHGEPEDACRVDGRAR